MPALAYDRKPEGKCIAAAAPGNYSPISVRLLLRRVSFFGLSGKSRYRLVLR
jgi:hypothetical protein